MKFDKFNSCRMLSLAKTLKLTRSMSNVKYKPPLRLDFYYDTISPYSWIAFEILSRYRQRWNLQIDYQPVFIAGIAKAVNNQYLNSLKDPNKLQCFSQDLERVSEFAKIPLRIPENLFYLLGIAGSLRQQRFLTAVKLRHPDLTEDVSRQLWYRCWSEDMDLASDKSLMIVGRRSGMTEEEVTDCISYMGDDTVKNELKTKTKEAVVEGAHGLPFLMFHRGKNQVETFFGSDRFELIAHRFGLEWLGPVPPDTEDSKFLEMPSDNRLFLDKENFHKVYDDFMEAVKNDENNKLKPNETK